MESGKSRGEEAVLGVFQEGSLRIRDILEIKPFHRRLGRRGRVLPSWRKRGMSEEEDEIILCSQMS